MTYAPKKIQMKEIRCPYIILLGISKYEGYNNLNGVEKDMENLENLFKNKYKYPYVFKKVGKVLRKEARNFIQEHADNIDKVHEDKTNTNQPDSLIFIYSGHGLENSILGSDGRTYLISKIREKFSNDELDGLEGKPKLFILDCCRGSDEDEQVQSKGGPSNTTKFCTRNSNMAFYYATSLSFKSFMRGNNEGSYFIFAFYQLLDHLFITGKTWGLSTDMQYEIIKRVKEESKCKQTPLLENQLDQDIFFKPYGQSQSKYNFTTTTTKKTNKNTKSKKTSSNSKSKKTTTTNTKGLSLEEINKKFIERFDSEPEKPKNLIAFAKSDLKQKLIYKEVREYLKNKQQSKCGYSQDQQLKHDDDKFTNNIDLVAQIRNNEMVFDDQVDQVNSERNIGLMGQIMNNEMVFDDQVDQVNSMHNIDLMGQIMNNEMVFDDQVDQVNSERNIGFMAQIMNNEMVFDDQVDQVNSMHNIGLMAQIMNNEMVFNDQVDQVNSMHNIGLMAQMMNNEMVFDDLDDLL